jgi:hypothetical protein
MPGLPLSAPMHATRATGSVVKNKLQINLHSKAQPVTLVTDTIAVSCEWHETICRVTEMPNQVVHIVTVPGEVTE